MDQLNDKGRRRGVSLFYLSCIFFCFIMKTRPQQEAFMERFDRLWPDGPGYYYDDTLFTPGTDTFLLSGFPRLKAGLRVCDLGSGTGLLGFLLLAREPSLTVTGVELQPASAALADKTAAENGLADRLRTITADLRDHRTLFPTGSFDLVVSNPPYYPPGSGYLPASAARRAARSEETCTLADICAAAAFMLRWDGACCLVHKPERLTDLLVSMRHAGLEPKRLQEVCKTAGSAPSLILAEGRRGGKPGLTVLPPLILQTEDGASTPEVDALYFRTKENLP